MTFGRSQVYQQQQHAARKTTTMQRHRPMQRRRPMRRPPCRYLLKLRAEVEVMQQLGVSLNAVHLHEVYEDDANIHMVMELCEG